MDINEAYVEQFLDNSEFLSERLEIWFQRDRQLHEIELLQLFEMLRWKLEHSIEMQGSEQLIVVADQSNGKIPPTVEFSPVPSNRIAARTAHKVATRIAVSVSTQIRGQFEFEWIKTVPLDHDLPQWVSARTAEINAWHLEVTSELPTDGSPQELLARMHSERLVVEAWRDRVAIRDAPNYRKVATEPDSPATAVEQKVLTSLQRQILEVLDGQALTADMLQDALGCSRNTLFGRKDSEGLIIGGITELKNKGQISNDRKVGGYFRPDRPPTSNKTSKN